MINNETSHVNTRAILWSIYLLKLYLTLNETRGCRRHIRHFSAYLLPQCSGQGIRVSNLTRGARNMRRMDKVCSPLCYVTNSMSILL